MVWDSEERGNMRSRDLESWRRSQYHLYNDLLSSTSKHTRHRRAVSLLGISPKAIEIPSVVPFKFQNDWNCFYYLVKDHREAATIWWWMSICTYLYIERSVSVYIIRKKLYKHCKYATGENYINIMGVYLWKLTLRYWLASRRQLDKSQDSWDKGQEMDVTACLGQQNVLQMGGFT